MGTDPREDYEQEFTLEWDRQALRFLEFTKSDPFKKVVTELNDVFDEVLQKRFRAPLPTILKPVFLVYMTGQALEEWVKEKDAPLGGLYRKLLRVTVHSAALNHLVHERIQKEGPLKVRALIARSRKFLRLDE